jgi:CBS domain-containing membrane protein
LRRIDWLLGPICEGALLLVVALAGMATHRPLIFASLGPTAYELVETPYSKTARPYNIVVGHLIGVLAGFAALHVTHAWSMPPIAMGVIVWPRVWAALLAAMLTVLGTLAARAAQPAAVSTSLLISLGTLQTPIDGVVIMCAVVLMTLVGEPLRRWRERGVCRAGRE